MATDICLPILKFSDATGQRGSTIAWTHLQAADIFVIVKGTDKEVVDSNLILRVVQGNKVLESVEIGKYVDKAIETRRHLEQVGIVPQVEQLPIFGITKDALLAIRYQLEDKQPRRLQLRMQNISECRQVIAVLQRRGMEFQEQRPRTARPGTGRPQTDSSLQRPLTAQNSPPYFEPAPPGPRQSAFTLPTLEAGSLSQNRTSSPEKAQSSSPHYNQEPNAGSQEMRPPRIFTRDELTAPRQAVATRPTTAQIYRSYTTPSQSSQHEAYDTRYIAEVPHAERPSSTSNMANLEAIHEAVMDHETPQLPSDMPPPSARPTNPIDNPSSGTYEPIRHTLDSSSHSDPLQPPARHSTAASTVFADTLEHEIPPRRELPFARPDSRRTSSDQNSSRPGSSALTLPPLRKPNLARETPSSPVRPKTASPVKSKLPSPAKDQGAKRPGTASPLKRSFDVYRDGQRSEHVEHEKSPKSSLQPSLQPSSATGTSRRPSPMNNLLYGKKTPLAERSTNAKVPRVDSLADAPHEAESPPPSPGKAVATVGHANAYAALQHSLGNRDMVSTDGYAEQSREDREAALDNFMMEQIASESFAALCEDVENCWRRIALPLN